MTAVAIGRIAFKSFVLLRLQPQGDVTALVAIVSDY